MGRVVTTLWLEGLARFQMNAIHSSVLDRKERQERMENGLKVCFTTVLCENLL